ncbi:hypothetical protein [Selenomonas ruminantium]|uniref:hypothetical protein n=1 Tax=Selenomonas ruminantium TaxID=971 RepID=UPI0026F14F01|nr:hypothetical protein [Selenomonas ruminantium]
MSKYGNKAYFVYEKQEKVNTIWHDGFTFWLAPDNLHDAVGCSQFPQLRAIVDNMYDHPSYIAVNSEAGGYV